jgi:serine/threonine-protein kinase
LAYLESGLRAIRNGHRWRSGRFGSPILGALFGAAGWLFVSVLSSHEPSGPSGLGCALAGALAAVFTLLATERSARS